MAELHSNLYYRHGDAEVMQKLDALFLEAEGEKQHFQRSEPERGLCQILFPVQGRNVMRRIIAGVLSSLVLGSPAFAAQAGTGMDEQQISRYFGVISCVDRTFFDGGYDVGDPDRESLMSAVLAKYDLPKYDEELFQKDDEIKKDNDSYLDAYMACGADDWVIEVAEQRGIYPQE